MLPPLQVGTSSHYLHFQVPDSRPGSLCQRRRYEYQQRGRRSPDITEFLPFPGWVLEFESPGPLPGLPKATLWFPTVDCYSETEAEDPDEEAGSRSTSVSRVTSREEVGAGQQDVGGAG